MTGTPATDLEDLAGRAGWMSLWILAIGWLPGLVVLGAASGIVVRRLRGGSGFRMRSMRLVATAI